MGQSKLISIGYGNFVAAGRVVAVIAPESAPVKRMVQDARQNGSLVDGTCGRRTRAVVVTDSNHTVLSSLTTETIAGRLSGRDVPGADE